VITKPRRAAEVLLSPVPLGSGGYIQGQTVTIFVSPKPGWEIQEWVGPVYRALGEIAKVDMDTSTIVMVVMVESQQALPTDTPVPPPPASPPTQGCYERRSSKDSLELLSVDPGQSTTLQPGAEVEFKAEVLYYLDSEVRAEMVLMYQDPAGESRSFGDSVEVPNGTGTITLLGFLDVPDEPDLEVWVHLFPPTSVYEAAGFDCYSPTLDKLVAVYPVGAMMQPAPTSIPGHAPAPTPPSNVVCDASQITNVVVSPSPSYPGSFQLSWNYPDSCVNESQAGDYWEQRTNYLPLGDGWHGGGGYGHSMGTNLWGYDHPNYWLVNEGGTDQERACHEVNLTIRINSAYRVGTGLRDYDSGPHSGIMSSSPVDVGCGGTATPTPTPTTLDWDLGRISCGVIDCSRDEHRPEWGEGLIVLSEDDPSRKGIFELRLWSQPFSDAVLSIVSGDTAQVTVHPATLTFTSSNWDTWQAVTLTGVDDDVIDGDQTTMVTVSAVGDVWQREREDIGVVTLDDDVTLPTSWSGNHGTVTVTESEGFNIGSGNLEWSINVGQRGYFYTGTNPDNSNPVLVANVTSESNCGAAYKGYTGLDDVNELTNASGLTYSIAPTPNNSQGAVMIGSRTDSCNMGMLVFSQGGRYGVLDFLVVNGVDMSIEYWLGDAGVTDFSQAPD